MSIPSYASIPDCATRLPDSKPTDPKALAKITTSLPQPPPSSSSPSGTSLDDPLSPRKAAFNLLPQMLLAATIPGTPSVAPVPRGTPVLLSSAIPLSIPITTVNFKQFVSKVRPVFWIQDRVEEIIMWRKGTRHTCVWMAAYAFLCYFPRMVLLIPHIVLMSIILATHPNPKSEGAQAAQAGSPPPESAVDWQGNITAIQNLMGAFSDLYDTIIPYVPHLTHGTPYTQPIFSFLSILLIILVPLTYLLPLRPTFLFLGLSPFILTHPLTRTHVLPFLIPRLTTDKRLRSWVLRIVDDNNLRDPHWRAEMENVELWENERWNNATTSAPATASEEGITIGGGWSRANLKAGERAPWTRARDGASGGANGDVSSDLTFALSPGFQFVETEDWRVDVQAVWAYPVDSDTNGWIYTNDGWFEPQSAPVEKWKTTGMTRRRRWTRRVYHSGST